MIGNRWEKKGSQDARREVGGGGGGRRAKIIGASVPPKKNSKPMPAVTETLEDNNAKLSNSGRTNLR